MSWKFWPSYFRLKPKPAISLVLFASKPLRHYDSFQQARQTIIQGLLLLALQPKPLSLSSSLSLSFVPSVSLPVLRSSFLLQSGSYNDSTIKEKQLKLLTKLITIEPPYQRESLASSPSPQLNYVLPLQASFHIALCRTKWPGREMWLLKLNLEKYHKQKNASTCLVKRDRSYLADEENRCTRFSDGKEIKCSAENFTHFIYKIENGLEVP